MKKMIRKLRLDMMPPPGARRPEAITAFPESMETRLDHAGPLRLLEELGSKNNHKCVSC